MYCTNDQYESPPPAVLITVQTGADSERDYKKSIRYCGESAVNLP